jgi:molecular chaperone DnaJ
MAKKDYYEILNVKKGDSEDIIKKSYKKLAMKYHPDKAEGDKKKEHEEKFKEINEAYSTLSNKEKRQRYDMGGQGGFNQGSGFQGGGGGGFSDMFEDLLRGSGMGGFGGGQRENLDIQYRVTIEFEEAAFGVEKEIKIQRDVSCEKCKGTGSKDDKFETCKKCNGQGRINATQQTPWGNIRRTVHCNECNGEGKIIENKCGECNGSGVTSAKEKVKIKIPKGIDNGQTIRIQGAGNASKTGRTGDLFLEVRVAPHKIFKRDGFDIYMKFPITFSRAALGGQIKIPTLKKEIKVKLGKGTESGAILRLKGHGIPYLNSLYETGDQFVEIIVETPKKLTRAQKKLFKGTPQQAINIHLTKPPNLPKQNPCNPCKSASSEVLAYLNRF